MNAALGFYQEHRAEQSLTALRGMLPVKARVRRNGTIAEVEADRLVPGDIVLLEAGDQVAADGRLIRAVNVAIDELSLTGESQPTQKDAGASVRLDAPLADRQNMAFMNTLVTQGRGEIVVTHTGGSTAVGRISKELAAASDSPSPLQGQLDVLGKRLGGIALALVGLLGFLEYLRSVDLAHALLDASHWRSLRCRKDYRQSSPLRWRWECTEWLSSARLSNGSPASKRSARQLSFARTRPGR